MSIVSKYFRKASRWIRRKADMLIDESEELLERLPSQERSLFAKWLKLRLFTWGVEVAHKSLLKQLGPVMEKLDPGQREAVNTYLRELIEEAAERL